nr:MAG TPA: hypothetical protein [Caudoviricetes sp.]
MLYGGRTHRVVLVNSHAFCHMRVISKGLQVKNVY